MEVLFMLCGICPLVVAVSGLCLSFFQRGLKEELESLQQENTALTNRLERLEVRLEEKDRKLKKLSDKHEQALKQAEEHRRRGKHLKGEARKARRMESEIQEREDNLARRIESSETLLKSVQEELVSFKRKSAEQAEDIQKLKLDNARLE